MKRRLADAAYRLRIVRRWYDRLMALSETELAKSVVRSRYFASLQAREPEGFIQTEAQHTAVQQAAHFGPNDLDDDLQVPWVTYAEATGVDPTYDPASEVV